MQPPPFLNMFGSSTFTRQICMTKGDCGHAVSFFPGFSINCFICLFPLITVVTYILNPPTTLFRGGVSYYPFQRDITHSIYNTSTYLGVKKSI